jgi:hypothetical protein
MYTKTAASYYFPFLFLFFALPISFLACIKPDKKTIIGKWQSDSDWFEYFDNGTYDSGKDFLILVHAYRYTIDEKKNELNMYTNKSDKSYYLKYKFVGNDTLSVRNSLSTNTNMIKFYRVIENKKEE